jgi:serine/threonine protein kinase
VRESIGKYRLLKRLGEGGMGVVYLAEDPDLGRQVALKMLHEGLSDSVSQERMRREARAAASISHPHICQVYEVAEVEGELFLAMELLEGEALSDRMERGPLPMDEALQIVAETLAALEALHTRGFVHRDLKPSNVFLTPHGVKLLDFGLALPLDELLGEGEGRLTQTGMMVGTPAFMAPEQWRGEPVGPASDVFAMGAMAFELLSGRPAFQGASPLDIFHAIAHEQAPALVGGSQVAALDRVIQRALAKSPHDRYRSAAEMAADLKAVGGQTGAGMTAQARTITHLVTLPFRALRPDPDMDFLCHGLPDAVAAALSGLESLIVKPSANTDEDPDIAAVARAAKADLVLRGSLLRAGSRLRVTAQLLEAGAGAVRWTETFDAAVGDVFELQDELTRRLVASLSLPLTMGEEQHLRKARATTPEAHECYLRANQLANNSGMLAAARDLYLECVQRDPTFAPAWARLGRTHRVRAKYGHADAASEYALAEEAFRKALALDPDLPLAHSLFTYFEIEQLAAAPAAMVRLLTQAGRSPADPDLFTGLVVACRFCGLLDASVAADRRARRLDPGVRTSVAYTYWMQRNFEEAIRYDDEDMRYMVMDSLPMLGREEELRRLLGDLTRTRRDTIERNFVASKQAVLDGDRDACLRAANEVFASRFEDPEGLYHLVRDLAKVGATDLALERLRAVVDAGLHCPDTFEGDPWLTSLHALPAFADILGVARRGHEAARAAFEEAGGTGLLLL